MLELKVGDYITAVHFEGSVGQVVAFPAISCVKINWLNHWGDYTQHYTGSPDSWINKKCRILSEAEVTLFMLTMNRREESVG